MHNFYCYDPKVVSLNEMQKNAEKISKGDWYDKPEPCVIHMHSIKIPCDTQEHYTYEVKNAE